MGSENNVRADAQSFRHEWCVTAFRPITLLTSLFSCRCAFTSMYIPITLKRKSGKVVKSWHVNGAHNLEEVLQFIWRDLFLSMLATGSQRYIQRIPQMLDDIEDLLGWSALEKLLYGGRKCATYARSPQATESDLMRRPSRRR